MTYRSQVWLFPELKKGIYIEESGPQNGSWAIVHIAQYITDILIGEKPWLNVSTSCSFPEPWRRATYKRNSDALPSSEPPFPLQHYTGTYVNDAFGRIEVSLNASSIQLHMKMGRFLEGILGYDDVTKAFKLKLTHGFWYIDSLIPISISKPACFDNESSLPVMTILEMPLYSPYETSARVTFDRRSHVDDVVNRSTVCCISIAKILALNCYILLFFA